MPFPKHFVSGSAPTSTPITAAAVQRSASANASMGNPLRVWLCVRPARRQPPRRHGIGDQRRGTVDVVSGALSIDGLFAPVGSPVVGVLTDELLDARLVRLPFSSPAPPLVLEVALDVPLPVAEAPPLPAALWAWAAAARPNSANAVRAAACEMIFMFSSS